MYRKLLLFLVGIMPCAALQAVVISGGSVTPGSVTDESALTSTDELIIEGNVNIGASAVLTEVISGGAINVIGDAGDNGDVVNDSTGGLSIQAASGIDIAGITHNTNGVMTLDPGVGQTFRTAGIWSEMAGVSSVIRFANGSNFYLLGSANIVPGQNIGMMTSGNVHVGSSPGGVHPGDVDFISLADTSISVQTMGDIIITGEVNVAAGYNFFIGTPSGSGGFVDISIGSVGNAGILEIGQSYGRINSLTIGGAVNSAGAGAQVLLFTNDNGGATDNDIIIGGAITNGSGSAFSAVADDNLNLYSFSNSAAGSGNVVLTATSGGITVTDFIENLATGASTSMVISSGGSISLGGNLDNAGSLMSLVAAGGITVAGTMKNDMLGGTLIIGNPGQQAASLNILGGSATQVSFENLGDFSAYVSGASGFAYGISNRTAPLTSTFLLQTGSLSFANDVTGEMMSAFLQNALSSFTLNITAGNLSSESIMNGVRELDGGGYEMNSDANMYITAANILVGSVGVMNIGDTMNVSSAGTVTIGGVAANINGSMLINGETRLTLGSANNTGTMQLLSSNFIGSVNILGPVVNSGASTDLTGPCTNGSDCDLFINAAEIYIGGNLSNYSGIALVLASGTAGGPLLIDGVVSVTGGRLDVKSLIGLDVGGSISQTGGVLGVSGPYVSVATGISQTNGSMTINTNALNVSSGGISGSDGIVVSSATGSLVANITGNVTGAVQFVGLSGMNITGDYWFNDYSGLSVVVAPGASSFALVDTNTASPTYGQITNYAGSAPIISVDGRLITDLMNPPGAAPAPGASIAAGEIGLTLFDIVDSGDAIWLIHADGEVHELGLKMRNLDVRFCNADGSLCFDYLSAIRNPDGTKTATSPLTKTTNPDGLPAHISMRDTDDNGTADSAYIVFDPEFGGPVRLFKIQPIVEREQTHTQGEYESAGGLDELVAGGLYRKGFYNNTPVEAVPLVFRGTIFETMATELYDRMEQYIVDRGTVALSRFSRLFQPRELEQIAFDMSMAEHTNGQSFTNRAMDDFVWNRNRNKNKLWGDVSFGGFTNNGSDNKKISGNKMEINGGVDMQNASGTIFGIMARVSHMTSKNSDLINLDYGKVIAEPGFVDIEVTNTSVGFGAYMIQRLTQEARFYGRATLNADIFNISRSQNYVGKISGDGTAFSIVGEIGLLHDLWLQYLIGNVYARFGYNFGLSGSETVSGEDYMKLSGDGYFILTPGYSLMAQKRIYTSQWTYMRPYVSAGIEYDLGGFDTMQYKFAPAVNFVDYTVEMSPLWLNGRAGLEFAGVGGWHFGGEYEYKFNDIIKMNTIRIFGAVRF